jgi:hypothetical protein
MGVLVKKSACQFDLDRIVIEQIHQWRRIDRSILHQLRSNLPQFTARFHFVGIRIRILDQRRRNPHLF